MGGLGGWWNNERTDVGNEQMRVEVIRDTVARQNFVVPAGSVLQDVREFRHSYRGLWCSMEGSYFVTVPKQDCRTLARR
jgi:hypothetical protein